MFCLKCGAFIKEGQKFCKECSSPVNSLNEENTDIPSKNNNKSQKQEQNSNLISLNCPHCGGNVSFDMENIIAYCPYCGSELTVDATSLCDIIKSREETKRKQMEIEHLEKMKKMEYKQTNKNRTIELLKYIMENPTVGLAIVFFIFLLAILAAFLILLLV